VITKKISKKTDSYDNAVGTFERFNEASLHERDIGGQDKPRPYDRVISLGRINDASLR